MKTKIKPIALSLLLLTLSQAAAAGPDEPQVAQAPMLSTASFDPLKYTLGPDDVVEIAVMRHPEFSGVYPVNQEGKLQYKFVGDLDVNGLTKNLSTGRGCNHNQ